MAKREIPMQGGDEVSAFTSERHMLNWKPGERKAVKRKYNKRSRKTSRQECREYLT